MHRGEAALLALQTSIVRYKPGSDFVPVYASAVLADVGHNYDMPTVLIPVLARDGNGNRYGQTTIAHAARLLATALYGLTRPELRREDVYTYIALGPRHMSLTGWYGTICPVSGVRFLVYSPNGCIDQAKVMIRALYDGNQDHPLAMLGALAHLRPATPL